MTADEIKRLLTDLGQRQRIDTIDELAFARIMIEHTTAEVINACAEIRRNQPYINPHDLDQALNAGANTHLEHVMRLLADGKFNQRLDPADFPDQRSYQAARTVSPAMRTSTTHQARTAYLAAWRNTPASVNQRPALGIVRDELGA